MTFHRGFEEYSWASVGQKPDKLVAIVPTVPSADGLDKFLWLFKRTAEEYKASEY